jgi:hypothetical protein
MRKGAHLARDRFLTHIDGIDYELFSMSDAEPTLDVVTEAFINYEPMTAYQEVTSEAFQFFAGLLLEKADRERLTTVARDCETGNIIGAMISEDIGNPEPPGLEKIDMRFGPIFTLLETLSNMYFETRPAPEPGEYAHLFMVGTRHTRKSKGVAINLVKQAVANARQRNYKVAYAEATGVISQHVFQKHVGFQPHHEIHYPDFIYEGEKVFSNIEGHPSCKLVALDL